MASRHLDDAPRAESAPAICWIEDNLDDRSAYRALRGLLDRHDLDDETLARAVTAALAWLDRNEQTGGARLILSDLLARHDLHDEDVDDILDATFAFLDRRGAERESDFVIRALLSRGDLDPEPAARAVTAALAWLDLHGALPEAQFTLRALLRREEMDHDEARRAVKAALAWLDLHRERAEASFVLPLLLARSGFKKGEGPRVVQAALAWLGRHGTAREAEYVLGALVRSRHISPDNQHRAGEAALTWFRATPPERDERRHVLLLHLLRRASCFDDGIVRAAADEILRGLPGAALPPETHSDLLFALRDVARRIDRVDAVRALAASAPAGLVVPRAPAGEMRRLAEQLTARAGDTGTPVDAAWLRAVLTEVGRQVDQRAARAAVAAVPGMLALAARLGDEAILAEAVELAADVLHEAPERRPVKDALRACRALLDVWPDRAAGERVIGQLAASLGGEGDADPDDGGA
jgi:hypothetical protein